MLCYIKVYLKLLQTHREMDIANYGEEILKIGKEG